MKLALYGYAAGAAALFLSTALFAQTGELSTPPKGAKSWSIVSAGGKHGDEYVWTDKDGVRHSRMNILLRGLVYDLEQTTVFGANGLPTSISIKGVTPAGDATETFSVSADKAAWKTPADSGEAAWRDGLLYIPFNGPADGTIITINALLADEDGKLDALPGGAVRLSDLTTHEVKAGKKTKKLKAVALDGLSFSPQVVWLDDNDEFFASVGTLGWLPPGWESVRDELVTVEQAALAERAPAVRAKLLKEPKTTLFKKVTIYDAETNGFKKNQSVLVEGGKIAAVGKSVKAPEGATVIDGKGKTLVPGLWDMHHHYGDDNQGPLDLSQGVTSVRDIGNDSDVLLARKKRIDDGELLGPKIYPIVGIDGDGPLSAQSFERIHSVEEGVATIQKAKAEGYYGIKLYGTINPEWVKPLAEEAHKHGMSVQGHIPAGMRPSEAVAAGYDGINHINFLVMEGMPEDVLKTSNGLNRFFGPGRYAKDLDLESAPMQPFLATLAEKKTVVDPTLAVYELIFIPEQGEVAAGYAPYIGTVPPQVERQFKQGGLVAPEGYEATREDMRASFKKLVETVARLHELGAPIVAGTDGLPSDLIREMELYTTAGMTIGDALETATDGAARTMGVGDKVGSIAEGQDADLLLIDGDVSQDIGMLRQVESVMLGGSLMDAQALRAEVGITGPPAK